MAEFITWRRKKDGGLSASVRWREHGRSQHETFSKGTPTEVLAMATKFRTMVELNGNRWPESWVPGKGFVDNSNVASTADTFPPVLAEQIVRSRLNITKGTLRSYLGIIKVLASIEVHDDRGQIYSPFHQDIGRITEADITRWIQQSTRSRKTLSNHHGLLYSVMETARRRGIIKKNPCEYTKISRRSVMEEKPETLVLSPKELEVLLSACESPRIKDLVTVAVATGCSRPPRIRSRSQDAHHCRSSSKHS